MADRTFQAFLTAIEREDDTAAERLSHELTTAYEADLLALAQSEDVDQRWWTVRTLAHCGTEHAISVLTAALQADDNALRAVAALSLCCVLHRSTALEPEVITNYLAEVGHLLGDDDGLVRQSAADALAQCGEIALPVLKAILENSHEGARARAANALRKIGTAPINPAAAPLLFQHLNDPNYLVRTYAYEALDEMGLLDNVIVTL